MEDTGKYVWVEDELYGHVPGKIIIMIKNLQLSIN